MGKTLSRAEEKSFTISSIEPKEEKEFLPFALPLIGSEEIAAVMECMQSGWITSGPRVKEFEAAFAATVGSKHAVAVNSCTAALHLALEALKIAPDDEVLVPSMTFAATAEIVRYLNARPVLLDCDPVTLNLNADCLQAYLEDNCGTDDIGTYNRNTGARVRAVIPVHFGGLPCPMNRILELAQHFGLQVLEDAAHAIPGHYRGRPLGTLGRAGAFSFYANKNITTGEGGMLITQDDEIAERVRLMSLHGISRDAWLRYTERGNWFYEIVAPGFKYNMPDIAAAMGVEQLKRRCSLWMVRNRYAARYTAAFQEMPEIESASDADPDDQHAWHLYVIKLRLERLRIDRAEFIQEMKRRGIGTSVHYTPLHLHPYYKETYDYTQESLPIASAVYPRLVSLPLYARMKESDVDRVIESVCDILEKYRR